jgi:hypothetical protein
MLISRVSRATVANAIENPQDGLLGPYFYGTFYLYPARSLETPPKCLETFATQLRCQIHI